MTQNQPISLQLPPELMNQLLVYQSAQQLNTPAAAVVQIVRTFLAQSPQGDRPDIPFISTLDYLADPEDEPDEILYDFLPDEDEDDTPDYLTYPASSGS